MIIVTEIKAWQAERKKWDPAKKVGFIPTMGHLHAGHISLCQRSKVENDITVVSIFVNPTQFNDKQDFNAYPQSINEDKTLLLNESIDYLFLPNAENLYPDNYHIRLSEIILSEELEGQFRPGHFTGMLTVVLKLLNLVRPTKAYFGEKDYQQYLLVQKMVEAIFLPVEIIPCQTVRAEDGLALSSRNSRLSAVQRQRAVLFSQLLQSSLTPEQIKQQLILQGFKVDYIVEQWQRRLGAVWIDDIRLIDNISIS